MRVTDNLRYLVFSLLLTVITLSAFSNGEETSASSGWEKYNGFCYWFSNEVQTWDKARRTCKGKKADLVDIKSIEEKTFVLDILANRPPHWIGLNRSCNKTFKRIETEEVIINQQCFVVNTTNNHSSDVGCTSLHQSVCVKQKGSSDNCTSSGNCCAGWNETQDSCYLFVKHHMTWLGASMNCFEKNASLPALNKLFPIDDNMTGGSLLWLANKLHILVDDSYPEWAYINGEDFENVSHQAWIVEEYHIGYTEGCGSMSNKTILLSGKCSERRPYICKGNENSSSCGKWIPNGSYWYLFSTAKLSWNATKKNCSNCGGELLTVSDDDEGSFLRKHLSSEDTSNHYWFGLHRNRSTRICGFYAEDSTSFKPDYELLVLCSVINKKKETSDKRQWTKCNERLPFICVRDTNTSPTICNHTSWKQSGESFYFLAEHFRLTWLESQIYCLNNNATLPSWNTSLSMTVNLTRYWIRERRYYRPRNPVSGWAWVNESNLNINDGKLMPGKLSETECQHSCWCGALKDDGFWYNKGCDGKLHFICKKNPHKGKDQCEEFENVLGNSTVEAVKALKKVTEKCSITECSKDFVEKVYESISDTLNKSNHENEGSGGNKDTENTVKTEEMIEASVNFVNVLVNKSSFSESMSYTTAKLDINVVVAPLNELRESRKNDTNVTSNLPSQSIEKLCNDSKNCTVKEAELKFKHIKLDFSWLSTTVSWENVDVISLDYHVSGRTVDKLEGTEKLSIEFKRKEKKHDSSKAHCLYLDNATEWKKDGIHVNDTEEGTVRCITNHLSSFTMVIAGAPKQPNGDHGKAIRYISYIGCGLSLTALAISLLVYAVLHKDVQVLTTSRHIVHLNMQLSLGLAQIIFLVGAKETANKVACKIVAILLHYFTMASFCWMLLEGAMLYLKLISVYGGEVVGMKGFHAFGWGLPFFFVGIAALVKRDGYGTDEWCWLSYDKGYFWVFFAPLIIIITVNFLVLLAVMRVLFNASRKESKAKTNVIVVARGLLILFPVLGLSWVFSVISVNHDAIAWKYLFAIFNSAQGFLIFLIYGVCNKEITSALKRKVKREVMPTSSIMVQPASKKSTLYD